MALLELRGGKPGFAPGVPRDRSICTNCVKGTAPAGSGQLVSHEPSDPAVPVDSAALFRRYAPFVASFLFRQGVRGVDIDDLVQEVFLTAHVRGGYRPGPASPTTFLARIALEANLKRRRGEGRRGAFGASALTESFGAAQPLDPPQMLAEKEDSLRLQRALDGMDPEPRAIFVLFELDGESCASIAAGLGIPVGTVYSRLHSARRHFRASLSEQASGRGDARMRLDRRSALALKGTP
jgi:RNA polymerase sigma-70 factor (ECF subfamily)